MATRRGKGRLSRDELDQTSEYGGKPKKDVQIGCSVGNQLREMYTSDPGRPPRGRK